MEKWAEYKDTTYTKVYDFMTLRDYFAGQFLSGVMADPNWKFDTTDTAAFAYAFADAMLKARK